MKRIFFAYLVTLVSIVNAQKESKVMITSIPQTVPEGKVWKIERNIGTFVELSDGSFRSGTLCNAMLLSRPGIIFNVNTGDYFNAQSFTILFEGIEKVYYANDYTYFITPISIVDESFKLSDLQDSSPEKVGNKEVVFKAGQSVFVSECLVTIEVTEYDMTTKKEALKPNLNIPIKPQQNFGIGSIPLLKDSLLSEIVFGSSAVVHKLPGQPKGYDDVSSWTMTLTPEYFELNSSNGINKVYNVLSMKYDDSLRMQEFQLGTNEGTPTHNVNVAWNNSSKRYSVILYSLDNSEEFQFQETQALSKR